MFGLINKRCDRPRVVASRSSPARLSVPLRSGFVGVPFPAL